MLVRSFSDIQEAGTPIFSHFVAPSLKTGKNFNAGVSSSIALLFARMVDNGVGDGVGNGVGDGVGNGVGNGVGFAGTASDVIPTASDMLMAIGGVKNSETSSPELIELVSTRGPVASARESETQSLPPLQPY